MYKNDGPVTMPDGQTVYVDTYGVEQNAYFGDPVANQEPFRAQEIQVSPTQIKTFADEYSQPTDEVYFRMYVL